jgi:hypothetical protein
MVVIACKEKKKDRKGRKLRSSNRPGLKWAASKAAHA